MGLDQRSWILAHIALTEARNDLLIPLPPKLPKPQCVSASPVAQIHPMALFWLLKCRFSDLGFLSVGRRWATFLCQSFRKVSSNKNLGFSSPGVSFDLGCPFYCSSFPVFDAGVLHICGDFHRHVLCSDRHGCASGLKTPVLSLSLIRFE